MKITKAAAALAIAALALTACGKNTELTGVQPAAPAPASSSSTPAPAPTSDDNFPTPEPADLETTSEEPDTTVTEGNFGDTGTFTQEDVTFEVTVKRGVKAKCNIPGYCDKAETGDRFINVPITIKNTGKSGALEVSESMFVIEFADGTRLESSDGKTYQYGPDNTLSYGQKVRPGGTLKTSLTFEAPKGNDYSIVMLTSAFGGEDLFIWK